MRQVNNGLTRGPCSWQPCYSRLTDLSPSCSLPSPPNLWAFLSASAFSESPKFCSVVLRSIHNKCWCLLVSEPESLIIKRLVLLFLRTDLPGGEGKCFHSVLMEKRKTKRLLFVIKQNSQQWPQSPYRVTWAE